MKVKECGAAKLCLTYSELSEAALSIADKIKQTGMDPIEKLHFLAPGTGAREGGGKTQPFNRFSSHRVKGKTVAEGSVGPLSICFFAHLVSPLCQSLTPFPSFSLRGLRIYGPGGEQRQTQMEASITLKEFRRPRASGQGARAHFLFCICGPQKEVREDCFGLVHPMSCG